MFLCLVPYLMVLNKQECRSLIKNRVSGTHVGLQVSSYTFSGESDRDATMEDLKSMHYLECCIKVNTFNVGVVMKKDVTFDFHQLDLLRNSSH